MTGLALHEILGLVFIVPILVHLVIARPWTMLSWKGLLHSQRQRTRINFALNLVLFVLIIVALFSGIEISQVVFPRFGFSKIDDRSWRALHNQPLNWVRLAVALHIAMNWGWITAALRRLLAPIELRVRRTFIAQTWPAVLIWGLATLVASAVIGGVFYLWLGPPTMARLYRTDEIARFHPTLGHALLQFTGQAFLICVTAYIGRKWLRMKL